MLIAMDHGNKQMKLVQSDPFISGLSESEVRPFGSDVLKYGEKYYQISDQRIPYRRDKTEDDRFFILTLFGIAHEIEAAGAYVPGIIRVQLAVGLPPAHYGAQNEKFTRYFSGRGVVSFTYRSKSYSVCIDDVACYPQSYAAAASILQALTTVPLALVVDIGGYTMDYIGGSIGLLIGVVIAILALVRGTWRLPLLIGTFAVWGLWLLWTQVLPFRRTLQARRQRERAEAFNRSLAQTLLHHVNYRVSACLKAGYPDVRWEWMMHDPALFVAQGGTGRIRVYGIPNYEYADVTVDQSGRLSCALVKMVSVEETKEPPAAPNQQKPDHEVWYESQGRDTLGRLVADLESRGHNVLTVQEDGSICISPKADGKEVKQGVLPGFPAKALWPELVKLLEQDGLAATVQNDCIAVTW